MSWRSRTEEIFEHNELARVQVVVRLADTLPAAEMLDFEDELCGELLDGFSFESVETDLDQNARTLTLTVELFQPQVDYEQLSEDAAHDHFYGVADRIGDQVAELVKNDEAVTGVSAQRI